MIRSWLVWGPSDVNPSCSPNLSKEGLKWYRYQGRVFDPVEKLLKEVNSEAFAFCLVRAAEVPWGKDFLHLASPGCLDNLCRNLIRQALEVVLLELIPRNLGDRHFRCAVYVASRTRAKSDVDPPNEWQELPHRYGIKIFHGERGQYFHSISPDGVYPMVAEVLASHPSANANIVCARGARLTYHEVSLEKNLLPRPAHFLADLVTRYSRNKAALEKQPSLNRWLDRGFVDIADDKFGLLLEASRHARFGRSVEVVLCAHRAGGVKGWGKKRLGNAVSALTGRQYIEFCNRLGRAGDQRSQTV